MIPVDIWAVIAARTSPSAKSRLAEVLTADDRIALARRMLAAVLDACRQAGLGGVVLVTDTPAGVALGDERPATLVADPGSGLNAAYAHGIRHISPCAKAVLLLPGDVPLIAAADVHAICHAAGRAPTTAVIVPDGQGRGTNALLLRPPRLIEPSFGEPSCERHLLLAQQTGATTVRLELPRVALDVDTPAALRTYLARAEHARYGHHARRLSRPTR